MTGGRDLRSYLVPRGRGAAFAAYKEGGLAVLRPLTDAGRRWLVDHIGEEARWDGDRLVIELRYFLDIADAILDAGFLFEADEGSDNTIQ